MFFAIVTLITALSMAGIAAWFAIAGIMALFAGAAIPALIMGSVVELGKIVGVSWIYRHWKERTSLKYIMIPFVTVAVLLTSMGIFGFLSKAHIEQNAPVANNTAKIERLDQRVGREKARIADADVIIGQLDNQVQVLIDYNKISDPVNGSRAVRAGQQEQRDALAARINEAQDNIDEYEDEKLSLSSELRELEIEVGPVKYIAEMIFEDPKSNLDRAVRMVIIAFIFVFDPMAILLLMGANFSFMKLRGKEPGLGSDDPDDPDPDDDPEPPTGFKVTASAVESPEDLIKLIDDDPLELDPVSNDVLYDNLDALSTPPEEVVEQYEKKDRQWLDSIPEKDENVTGTMIQTAMERLKGRDRTNDEQVLVARLRKLATARNIPWDIASHDANRRALVTTKNPILKT